MGLIRWLADKVQSETGEKERRKNVGKIKELVLDFKYCVSLAIDKLNQIIDSFNYRIRELNNIRNGSIGVEIAELRKSLVNYGNCKPVEDYVKEKEKIHCSFPEEDYCKLEDIY